MGPPPAGLDEIEQVVSRIISVVVGLGFITLLITVIVSGFKYLISAGEAKAIQSARQTFTWALLGLVFMAVAWLVLQLIASFTGLPLTVFDIKKLCLFNDTNWCQP